MSKLETITVAQIGCGYWGPNLLRNFSSIEGCRVKYVVDSSEERRQFVQTHWPATQAVSSVDQVLEDPEVQAVIVVTPAATHYQMGRRALEAGKHILVEKPFTMTTAEADDLAAIARPKGLKMMVGHTFIYHPAVKYIKRLIDQGDLGRIYCVYTQRLNLGVVRSDVNVMWNLAPHDVSILCHFMGEAPLRVQAAGTAFLQPGIEDVVFMNLNFAKSVHANVHVSWLDPNKTRKVTVVGDKKMVVYDDVADDKITIYDKGIDLPKLSDAPFDQPAPFKMTYRAGDIVIPKVPFKEPLRLEAEHFLASIRNNTEPVTGYEHARGVVQVLEKAQKSLKTNTSIEMNS